MVIVTSLSAPCLPWTVQRGTSSLVSKAEKAVSVVRRISVSHGRTRGGAGEYLGLADHAHVCVRVYVPFALIYGGLQRHGAVIHLQGCLDYAFF